MIIPEWERCLINHADKGLVRYITQGFREGFRVGFDYNNHSCTSAKSNMKSATDNEVVIDRYLAKEVRLGRVIGPLDPEGFPGVNINRFGVIPKSHQPGKWRLIVDLSHPDKASVNDGIDPRLCSLHYTSVDEAVREVVALGPRAQMAKFDIESAYRIVPVHPDDRPLLGMAWKGKYYVDTALPFGLRSAPKIFNTVADTLQWILESQGVRCLHYLDDFFLVGRPDSQECAQALARALEMCARLGVPIAVHKTEGPFLRLTFLGIEIDTETGQVRLPEEKLRRLQREIREWQGRRSCTKRELLSIIGQLQHACCVVKPGRTFLRRMITLSTVVKEMHHRIRLNCGFRSDLQWWATFLPSWNGVGTMVGTVQSRVTETMTSDASGTWGCGAFTSPGEWFQLKWPDSWASIHITVKELLPIIMGVAREGC